MGTMTDQDRPAGARTTGGGEYIPAGEGQRQTARFTADQVAEAFGVQIDRVRRAMQGEFKLDASATVTSRQAQLLAEVILGDRPLDTQQAALMQLGAYTPRFDEIEGSIREEAPGEESDRIRPSEEVPDIGAPREDGG